MYDNQIKNTTIKKDLFNRKQIIEEETPHFKNINNYRSPYRTKFNKDNNGKDRYSSNNVPPTYNRQCGRDYRLMDGEYDRNNNVFYDKYAYQNNRQKHNEYYEKNQCDRKYNDYQKNNGSYDDKYSNQYKNGPYYPTVPYHPTAPYRKKRNKIYQPI